MEQKLHENCPYAFRKKGDPQVHCMVLQKRDYIRWTYCVEQFDCRKTGRYEASLTPKSCKLFKEVER